MQDAPERLNQALSGRYRIVREVGAGGMATVYLAEDLKHRRQVALKVLKPELSAIVGAERFLQEIEVTAGLQHPNILPLYDSGEADGLLYYVMPFVEGETLRDRLDREKQLSLEQTLGIAKAVAAALDYAHERGVVHRDIKPANILLQAGQALVADFGIALAVSQAGGTRLTETGLSLGTPHYMSPEQATGDRLVDARSDIYSLGAVLYEMLVGDPPHTGNTVQAVVAKVLTENPTPIRRSREQVPRNVDAAVGKALARTPADRFARAEDLISALTDPQFGLEGVGPRVTERSRLLERLAWLAAIVVTGGLALTGRCGRQAPLDSDAIAFTVTVPNERAIIAQGWGTNMALSPDGNTLAYVGISPIERQLYIRPLGELEVQPLEDTEGAYNPVFSPNGDWIAFITGDEVKRVRARGGAAQTLARLQGAVLVAGLSWKNNDTLVVLQRPGVGLATVPAAGGSLTTLVAWEAMADFGASWPEVLPDGDAAILAMGVRSGANPTREIGYYDFETGTFESLGVSGIFATYSSNGHLVVVSAGGAVTAIPFDHRSREVTGEPIPLLPSVAVGAGEDPRLAVAGGTLVYAKGVAERSTLVLVDRDGGETPLLSERRAYRNPRFAPGGEQLAVTVATADGSGDLWIYDHSLENLSRLTFESDNFYPEWAPDGNEIAFTSRRISRSPADIFVKRSDGSGDARLLHDAEHLVFTGPWLPDGSALLARETHPERGFDLWLIPRDTSESPRILLASDFNEAAPAISPDGRWLAYVSDESGRNEVYVRAYLDLGGRWQVSAEGGAEPRWGPDGREIFYRRGSALYSATVDTRSGLSVLGRELLFEGPYARQVRWADYDVHPDGQRFVMIRIDQLSNELVVVVNWAALLRGAGRRVGGQ